MQQSLKKIFALFALAIMPISFGLTPDNSAAPTPDHIALTWTGDPATTMTITWRTDASVTSGFVQYRKGETLTKALEAKAESRDFMTDLGLTRLFACTLVNLSPNANYAYRVGNGEHWSRQGVFSTAAKKTQAFKFLIFGDSQSRASGDAPYGIWRQTLHNAYQANPDAKFFVNVGDLVDYGQLSAHWNAWFAAAKGVIDRIPVMPVSGNHETYGSRKTTRPQFWTMQFSVPQNGPEGLKGQAYSFDYGPVHFVVLDSQQEEQTQYGDIFKMQQPWLDADLAASKALWNIVFFHKPAYGVHPMRNSKGIQAAFAPILEKHHVDLVFSGHDHGIARTYPIKAGAYRSKPSQGTIYYVAGRSGEKVYKEVKKMEWDTFFHNPLAQPNYFVVEVAKKKIRIQTVNQDGTLIDDFAIDKRKDVSTDSQRLSGSAPLEKKRAA